ncbi:acyl-[acyl-carrier-protein] thioesterase [Mycolicibacterium sp. lyk4-40-TYG-92]|uniref:acyl-[acyl-carrier-protein] thioesterase n=1 Tax=Mycolicibacterium sp. lyk4-40-TYG-92 TaxID=3040295 RepID=UPI00254D1907|nr:acyl-[acyl-carrier-protein] thioesterase [Mycolicibacterium sp. lyk4-40-TYG-92]
MSTVETAEKTAENATEKKATAAGVTGLTKALMPVPEGHPDVFDTSWPLRMADVDRDGRLRFDGACRHIQDIGQDQLRQMGYEDVHPAWVVRRTMVDLIRPFARGDILRLRRWCSGTSNRWCEMRVRIDGRKGGLIESEAFWINMNLETQGPARISDDFLAGLKRTASTDRLRWKGYLKAGAREDAVRIADFPVRVSDIDLFDHMNNSVYWSVVEDYLQTYRPELLEAPLRVTIEHDAAVALGERLEIITHEYPAGSTEKFGPELCDRSVTTLTYVVGDEVKAVACLFAL